MSDRATALVSASVFPDNIKSSMAGISDYIPKDIGDKWIYFKTTIDETSGDLFDSGITFLGTTTAISSTNDEVRWIAIKNTSSLKTSGLGISLVDETVTYTLVNGIYLAGGEMIVLKPSNVKLNDIQIVSVKMDGVYGYPSAAGTGITVGCEVSAIVDDASV